MICDKCDPAGHIAGEEREFLKRVRREREAQLKQLHCSLASMLAGDRPFSRFTGEQIAEAMRDLDAINNLGIVIDFGS